jgi:hypothetical protein
MWDRFDSFMSKFLSPVPIIVGAISGYISAYTITLNNSDPQSVYNIWPGLIFGIFTLLPLIMGNRVVWNFSKILVWVIFSTLIHFLIYLFTFTMMAGTGVVGFFGAVPLAGGFGATLLLSSLSFLRVIKIRKYHAYLMRGVVFTAILYFSGLFLESIIFPTYIGWQVWMACELYLLAKQNSESTIQS